MGLAAADLGRELAEAAAPGTVVSGPPAEARSVAGVRPRFLVEPTTVTGVSRVLALASARGLAVAPMGRGARLGWGAPPRRLDVVLSLAKLDRILAHEPADLTLSVEGGATLEGLNAILGAHRQFLPLDPAHPAISTIGGLIATGAAGPYRARYGTMRDLLLGLTVVRADGTVVKGGGRVVKNVSGYDIPKLHVGALGTLGVVVEAHLRLHARPAEERSWAFGFASAEAALHAALEARDTSIVLSRCQILTGGALRALGESDPPDAALAVTIGSVPEAVHAQGARLADIGGRSGSAAIEVPEADALWRQVAERHVARGSDAAPVAEDRDPPERQRQGVAGGGGGPARGRPGPGHDRRGDRGPPRRRRAHRRRERDRPRDARPGGARISRRNLRGRARAGRGATRPSTSGATSGRPSSPCDA